MFGIPTDVVPFLALFVTFLALVAILGIRNLYLGIFPAAVALVLLGLIVKEDGLFGDSWTMTGLIVGAVLGLIAGCALILWRRANRQSNGG